MTFAGGLTVTQSSDVLSDQILDALRNLDLIAVVLEGCDLFLQVLDGVNRMCKLKSAHLLLLE